MSIYCSVTQYLEKENPEFKKLLDAICIGNLYINTLLVPPPAKVTEIKKKLDAASKSQDVKAYAKMIQVIYSHIFYIDVSGKRFNDGGLFANRARVLAKFSPISKGQFTMSTGPKYETVAKCTIDPQVTVAESLKGDKLPFCIVHYTGDIDPEGNLQPAGEKAMTGASEHINESQEFVGGNDIVKIKTENFYTLLKGGRDYFTMAIAGLFDALEKNTSPELNNAKKIVATLNSYDAFGLYIVLVQPFSTNSFLPDRLFTTEEWAFAHKHTSDYVSIFESASKNISDYNINVAKRDSVLAEARDLLKNNQVGQTYKQMYTDSVSEIFGSDYLTPDEKFWADEVLFKAVQKFPEISEELPLVYSGKDYVSESTMASWEFNRQFPNTENKFVESEYFLKYTLVNDEKCRNALSKVVNPMSARARAFCMINNI